MNCTKCGLEIESGAAFCGNCGNPVPVAAQPVQAAQLNQIGAPAPAAAPVAPVPSMSAPPAAQAPASTSTPVPAPVPNPAPLPAIAVPNGPAYGMPAGYANPGGGKAIAAFVLGIIGLVGWLIPIIGFVLATLALIFGTTSTKSGHRKLAISGVVLGSITLILSLFSFAYNMSLQSKYRQSQSAATSIVTPVITSKTNAVNPLLQPY